MRETYGFVIVEKSELIRWKFSVGKQKQTTFIAKREQK